MSNCYSCGTSIHVNDECKQCVQFTPCPPPKRPECRKKSFKDACRVKLCPLYECVCPPPPCRPPPKCKVKSFKDECRKIKPCPKPVECCPACPSECKCVKIGSH